jgi:hypothetical protein
MLIVLTPKKTFETQQKKQMQNALIAHTLALDIIINIKKA